MQKSFKREQVSFLFVMGIFVLAAINITLFPIRIDLTSSQKFSIAPETKQILNEATDNIFITYYASKEIRNRTPMPDEVENFLYLYAGVSNGKVKVKILDPSSKEEIATEARNLGIRPNNIDLSQMSTMSFAQVFSGIRIQYLDRQEVLPLVNGTESLEYEITSKVKKLYTNKTRSIGLLIGNRQLSLDNSFRYIGGQVLPQLGTFRLITPGEPIENLDVLIVIGNETLEDYDVFQVDQYLMKGGKVFFAVDGVNFDFYKLAQGDTSVPIGNLINGVISQGAPVQSSPADQKPLNKLLGSYGVKVSSQLLLDSRVAPIRFQSEQGISQVPYAAWIGIEQSSVAKGHILTNNWPGVLFYWPSPLEFTEKEGLKGEVLISSSTQGAVKTGPFDINPHLLLQQYKSVAERKSYPIIYSLTGKFTSPYTPETIPQRPGLDTTKITLVNKSPDSRVLVAGNSLFLTDLMEVTNSGGNLAFLQGAMDWLSQDDTLLKIKTRPLRNPVLTGLNTEESKGSWTLILTLINVIFIPGLIIAVALIRYDYRKKRELES